MHVSCSVPLQTSWVAGDCRASVPVQWQEQQAICVAGLTRPKPNVFQQAVQYLMVICTTVEVRLQHTPPCCTHMQQVMNLHAAAVCTHMLCHASDYCGRSHMLKHEDIICWTNTFWLLGCMRQDHSCCYAHCTSSSGVRSHLAKH